MAKEISQARLETILNKAGTLWAGMLEDELRPYGKAVTEPLSEAMFSSKYSLPVREEIVDYLGHLEDSRAVAPLIRLAESLSAEPENPLYLAALEALGSLKEPRAIDTLLVGLPVEALPILKEMAEEDTEGVCSCCHPGVSVAEAAQRAVEKLEET